MVLLWRGSVLLFLLALLVGISCNQAKSLNTVASPPQKRVLSRYRHQKVRGDTPTTKRNRRLQIGKGKSTEEADEYDDDKYDDDDNYGEAFSDDSKGSKTNKGEELKTSSPKSNGGKGKGGKTEKSKANKSTAAKSQKSTTKSKTKKSYEKSENIFEHPEEVEDVVFEISPVQCGSDENPFLSTFVVSILLQDAPSELVALQQLPM